MKYILLLLLISCSEPLNVVVTEPSSDHVEVKEVNYTGVEKNYTFAVSLESPDTGCMHYADWWEVIDETGKLIFRRTLAHSHVSEQPFTRSGGPVNIDKSDVVIIRGHMNSSGFGSMVFKGSVVSGFQEDSISSDFAENLASLDPLPPKCAF